MKAISFLGVAWEVLEGFCRDSCVALSALALALSRALSKPEALAFESAGFPFSSDACFFSGDLPSEASAGGADRFADSPDDLLGGPAGTRLDHDKCCQLLHMQFESEQQLSSI